MIYTSFAFLLVLPIVIILYWHVNTRCKKAILLISNLFFLLSWSKYHLLISIFVTVFTFVFAGLIKKYRKYSGQLLALAISSLLILFVYFKFSNYFLDKINIIYFLNFSSLKIIVPIGFSFYMIQTIMFMVDVKKEKINFEDVNFIDYLIYNSYFLTIIQGPITKFQKFSYEIETVSEFNSLKFSQGINLIAFGLFKKLMFTSRASVLTNLIFNDISLYSGKIVIFGTILYSFELLIDFSAAVDISRGFSYLFGIELPINFNNPYSAVSIRDFWSRWHITLTSFFREYVYFPLGGNRKGILIQYRNILVIFILSALWHGTGLNFIIWGIYHAILQIIEMIFKVKSQPQNGIIKYIKWSYTFVAINIGWLIFKVKGIRNLIGVFGSIFIPYTKLIDSSLIPISGMDLLIGVFSLVAIFLLQRKNNRMFNQFPLDVEKNDYVVIFVVIVLILIFGYYGSGFNASDFIYMGF